MSEPIDPPAPPSGLPEAAKIAAGKKKPATVFPAAPKAPAKKPEPTTPPEPSPEPETSYTAGMLRALGYRQP